VGDVPSSSRFLIRDLPIVPRLVIAVFLVSVGLGYLSALVQLHFQQASAGQILPGSSEVRGTYHGRPGMGQLERLIVADEQKPFTVSGSMRSAFTFRAAGGKGGWRKLVMEIAEDKKVSAAEAEKILHRERDAEVNALVAWIHAGAKEEGYEKGHPLPDDFFKDHPEGREPNSEFFDKKEGGKWTAKINTILDSRCVRCHATGKTGDAGQVHLDSYKNVLAYIPAHSNSEAGGGMSLTKLAQSTHVHLLGFSMLYGLTGFCFAFTRFPLLFRAVFAPFALAAQLVEISFWWLARLDPMFADGIRVTGALVAIGLMIHIIGTLFDLFDRKGKLVLLVLILVGGLLGGYLKAQVIDPYLDSEKAPAATAE
jgi:hypothetical protein